MTSRSAHVRPLPYMRRATRSLRKLRRLWRIALPRIAPADRDVLITLALFSGVGLLASLVLLLLNYQIGQLPNF